MNIEKVEKDKFICTNPNLTIVTFENIFELVVIHVINLIYNIYGDLNQIKKLNGDVKKIFKYSLLDQIYRRSMLENDIYYILYINTSFTTFFSEIWTYIEKDKLKKFIIKTCKEISHNALIPMYIDENNINLTDTSGETIEIINKINNTLMSFKNRSISLDKLKKYNMHNGIIHFMHKYYPEDDVKKSVFYDKYLKGANNE